jgi:NAD(P)H-flavin reductase/ferredoxin/truncated hemoglobin YjbI
MSRITYEGRQFECRAGETVLDTLLRHGESPPFSCRRGVCLVCLQRCPNGAPPEAAQVGLRPTLARTGYFLPCLCRPEGDIEVAPPRSADLFCPAVIEDKVLLAPDVCRLRLQCATSLYYHAGQFVNLRRPDGLQRSYSLASLPTEDDFLELHVRRLPGGEMSNWIFDVLAVGDEVELQGPNGRTYYVPGSQDQDLLLIATGTGLAPLIGIVRDALHVGHRGRLRLVHGSRTAEGLYLDATLRALAVKHPQFDYVPCVSGAKVAPGFVPGRADDVAFARTSDLGGWRVFIAGLPAMVDCAQQQALAAGAAAGEIHTDPHEVRGAVDAPPAPAAGPPPPDLELWAALEDGALLNRVLTEFYKRVFADPLLAPYFHGVTMDRLVGQVYAFSRDLLTGQKQYFGMKPRAGHHWMVISDELFDHRERLLETCFREHGLAENMIQRWRRIDEHYRGDIVKALPRSLVVDGVEMPLEGFGEVELTVGGMCDGCQGAVDVGTRVRYHLRLGLTYCPSCAATNAPRVA